MFSKECATRNIKKAARRRGVRGNWKWEFMDRGHNYDPTMPMVRIIDDRGRETLLSEIEVEVLVD